MIDRRCQLWTQGRQCLDGWRAGHLDQSQEWMAGAGIAPRQLAHLCLKAVQLLKQNLMHGKKRLGDRLQRRMMLRKLIKGDEAL